MTTFQEGIDALNYIVAAYGGTETYQQTLGALNAWSGLLGGTADHDQNLEALNAISAALGGRSDCDSNIEALNEISRVLGGASDFDQSIDALNAIAELPVVGIVRIELSDNSAAEDASVGDLVGTLSVLNGSGSYVFTMTGTAGGLFALDGVDDTRVEVAGVLDYETATSHEITIEASGGDISVPPAVFTINVTDVEVESLAPGAPSIDLVAASDTGISSTDNITSDTTPDFDLAPASGWAFIEDDIITAYDNDVGQTPHTVTEAEELAGRPQLGLSALSAGAHSIQFTHERDGLVSPKSTALVVTIEPDALPPILLLMEAA